jgi:hypothetical protein
MDENVIGHCYLVDLMVGCRIQLLVKEGSSCFEGRIPGGVRGQTSCGRVSFGELRPQPSKGLWTAYR